MTRFSTGSLCFSFFKFSNDEKCLFKRDGIKGFIVRDRGIGILKRRKLKFEIFGGGGSELRVELRREEWKN